MLMPEGEDSEDWDDLLPELCHPAAARLLPDTFFWDCCDENSPFGNDEGADTLSAFRRWRGRYPDQHPFVFLEHLLESWQAANTHWEAVDPAQVQNLLEQDEHSVLVLMTLSLRLLSVKFCWMDSVPPI